MAGERENLINKINDIVSAFWADKKRPLLLSSLPNELITAGIEDYKTIADGNLKKFIELPTEDSTYKLIEHPTQRAKIGVMPKEFEFNYDDVSSEKATMKRSNRPPLACEESTVAFLKSLSKLSDEELESIVIPTKVLVKLFRKS